MSFFLKKLEKNATIIANMEHSASKIFKNTLLFTGALIMQKVISFAYFLYLSSRLAPESLGSYVWALSYTTLFSIGMDLGLSPILIREAAKDDKTDESYLRNILAIKLPLIFFTLAASLGFLFITKKDPTIIYLVLGAMGVMTFDALSVIYYSFLRAKQKIQYESAGIIGFQLITFIGGVLLLEITKDIVFVMLSLATASFVNFIFSFIITKVKFGYFLSPGYDKKILKKFLKLMPAFALAGIFVKIYNASDSVILGYVKDNAAVGLYSVPAKVVTAFQALIPGAFQATIYPSMSNYFVSSKEKLAALFERSFKYLMLISIPLAFGLYGISTEVIGSIWPKYILAIPTFKIMALALPFVFLAFPTGLLLRAGERQNANTWNRGIITGLSVLMNIMLIPKYGVLGAGITFFAVNAILLILDFIFVGKIIKYDPMGLFRYFLKILGAGVLMVLILNWSLPRLSLYPSILISAVGFLFFVFLFRIIKKEEIVFFKELWIKRQ